MIEKTKTLHQTYDNIADDYSDSIAIINAFYGKFYIKHMPRKRDSVLDIGCGTGDILAQLSKYFQQSFGIDPVKKFVTVAKSRALISTVQVGAAEDLPFESESMDYVVSHVGFQHVDRDRAIKEAARILRSGGKLIISEVLSNDATRHTPILDFYHRLFFNYFLLSNYGVKRTKQAKAFQTSSNWKGLTSIHRARRFNLQQLQAFYSKRLPTAKFKQLNAKITAVVWEKP